MSNVANLLPAALYDAYATLIDSMGVFIPVVLIVLATYVFMQLLRYLILRRGVADCRPHATWSSAMANVVQALLTLVTAIAVTWTGLNRIGWDASYIVTLIAPLASLWVFRDPATSLITWVFCVATRLVRFEWLIAMPGDDEVWVVKDIAFTGVRLQNRARRGGATEEWEMNVPCSFFMNNAFRFVDTQRSTKYDD